VGQRSGFTSAYTAPRHCFWATVCKTVHPICYQTVVGLSVLSVCPVCDVGVLWPNCWMDQGETWHAGSPRPWPQCVRWGPSSLPQKGAQPKEAQVVFARWRQCALMGATWQIRLNRLFAAAMRPYVKFL